jgi:hypothetical protein
MEAPSSGELKHAHRLIAVMVDHLHRDASGFRRWERAALFAVKRGPRVLVDVGFQRGFQFLERVLAAEKISVADEEAIAVIIRVDEPASVGREKRSAFRRPGELE